MTVEELRERIVDMELDSAGVGSEKEARDIVDSLIVASRTEGAEQKRLEILADPNVFENTRVFLVQDAGGDVYRKHMGSFFYVPASVLAPTKEKP